MPKVITDRKRIAEVLDRGVVVSVLPSKEEFVERLASGQPLRIYIGADPTSDSLHLSHAKNYMFLEELRQLGHEVIVLVGDFTAQIGDPTDRTSARKQLSEEEVQKNVQNWVRQIRPLMDFDAKDNPPRIEYNSKWLSPLSFKDVVSLAANFTVQQMLERDMFQKRITENAPIHLHEFLYPLMQGYDSVAMDVDAELCGTDQTFNALAGRTLMKRLKNKDKFVVAVNLMENPKTGELMSKSRGTGVFLSSPPNDMYGAIMAQPDEMTEVLYVNVTRLPLAEKNAISDPRAAKARVALDVVERFYGREAALAAAANFDAMFSKKDLSSADLPELKVPQGSTVLDLVMLSGVAASKSEARRLVEQGAVALNDEVMTDGAKLISEPKDAILKVGKRHFFRLSA